MTELNVLEAHNVIVNAITNDLAMIDEFTISGVKAANFDGHDSLGSAFYLYAYLKSGYHNLEFNLPPATMLMWIREKVTGADISPYIDKELAAIGLSVFALCKFHRGCPDLKEEFASLVEPHFESARGLYGNFLSSVLVTLGLKALGSDAAVLEKLETYVDYQLRNNSPTVFNDPKNLLVAHMWARESDASDLLSIVANEALARASREETLARDRVYYSYVLFEEISNISRKERQKVKTWILESLGFLYSYSVESAFSPTITEEYSYDVAAAPARLKGYSYPAKPRLSRILLSVGLLIDRKYDVEGSQLFSNENQLLRFARGTIYPVAVFALLAVYVYVTRQIHLPLSTREDIQSGEFIRILKSVCFKLPVDIIWMSVVILLICWAVLLFYYICWEARTNNEVAATKLTLALLKRNWPVEALIAGAAGFAASIAGLGG